ncbi:Bug family tripartite tricarboxylate transporter substrate binding protein [Parapusillimonas sp. JC17]|uniref:Bug family tripartite tricarboxylate transporter substrate binding protein n=1 Tax=Parapusillimonas sp. JC17 TaxID=3445768 RepID=UPI003F9FC0F0
MKQLRLATLAATLFSSIAFLVPDAHAYPDRPITVIAQQPPGSGSDAMTRIWADCVSLKVAQPLVVQNKPGANGILAINQLKGQPHDGYTVMSIGMSQMTITPYVYKDMPYDPAKDFAGVTVFGATPLILVAGLDSNIKSLDDLAAHAKSVPGGVNFGSPGKGSPAHLLTSALISKMNVPGTHIPFIGEGAGVTALIGNQIQVMTLVSGTALPQVKASKLVPIAIFADKRSPAFPDVPAITELLDAQDLARPAWIGVVAKKGVSDTATQRLNEATQQCLDDKDYVQRLRAMNVEPLATAGEDLEARAQADVQVWRPLIDTLGLATEN